MFNYTHPALVSQEVPGVGRGVFTTEPIPAGVIVVGWGGRVVDRDEFDSLVPFVRTHSLQLADELFLVPVEWETADYVNHSCDPSTGFLGSMMLVTRRDLVPGDEITFDYAMCDSVDYDEFPCHCGASTCRGLVSSADWRRPELWERYDGVFSPYLQQRIDVLRRAAERS